MSENKSSKLLETINKKIEALKLALVIETDASVQFKYETELEALEEGRVAEKARLSAIATKPKPASAEKKSKINVFLSYASEDEDLKKQLDKHLVSLRRSGTIAWNDARVEAGQNFETTTQDQFDAADIIMLLTSPDFIASNEIWENHVEKAMERHENQQAVVIPVYLKPCVLEDMPFEKIQGLPYNQNPITKHANLDAALMEVAKGVRAVAKRLQA